MDIEQLISRVSQLTEREISDLAVAWYSADRNAEWDAVWAAERAALEADRNAEWDAVWAAERAAAFDSAFPPGWGSAQNAVWYAALALMVKGQISEKHFNALYGPWGSVMDK